MAKEADMDMLNPTPKEVENSPIDLSPPVTQIKRTLVYEYDEHHGIRISIPKLPSTMRGTKG